VLLGVEAEKVGGAAEVAGGDGRSCREGRWLIEVVRENTGGLAADDVEGSLNWEDKGRGAEAATKEVEGVLEGDLRAAI
jgi:hypothetical protein